jgi:two-component system NtrC family sensor kinase
MLRTRLIIFLFLPLFSAKIFSQNPAQVDSMKGKLALAKSDTDKMQICLTLSWDYLWSDNDSALFYAVNAIGAARKINDADGLISGHIFKFIAQGLKRDDTSAIQTFYEAQKLVKERNQINSKLSFLEWAGILYNILEDYEKSLRHLFSYISLSNVLKQNTDPDAFLLVGQDYYGLDMFDSALIYEKAALKIYQKNGIERNSVHNVIGNCYRKKGELILALNELHTALFLAINLDKIDVDVIKSQIGLAQTFYAMGNYDSSLYYCKAATTSHNFNTFPDQQFIVYDLFRNIYRIEDNVDSAYKYMSLTLNLKDSIFSADKARAVQRTEMEQELKTRELEDERNKYENRLKVYALISGLGVLLIVAFILYRNNRHKQEANILLLRQKEKIESTLLELKSTQAQLIQSEKMASLGELTAGIAHEIQNPLNFVNNFSEVNNELADELVQEAATGNLEAVKAIAKDIKDNQQKINHHGKRADAIVKGMLQHSRTGSGTKEPTDINRLADEYLRLAYQGFRAKYKSFNVTLTTEFDPGIGEVTIVPQDIGRAIVNLVNNALYAVSEKAKQNIAGYEPTVTVATRKVNDKLEVRVADNGNGIPEKILDKILQPFFTTKPTGQGTGLGLSLAYDIVKAHGGEIKVETKEGEGSEFIIQLPA